MQKHLVLSGVMVAMMLGAGHARAQGYPVVDHFNVEQAVTIAGEAAEQVSRLGEIYGSLNSVKDAIGARGNQQGLQGLLSMSNTLQGMALRLPALTGQPPFKADTPKTVANLRTHAVGSFYAPTQPDAATQSQLLSTRQQSLREAAVNGYAVALQARDDAAASPDRIATLAKSAENAQDLRQDILAGNAALLAMVERMSQIQAAVAALLEIEAAHHLAVDQTYTYAEKR